MHVHKTEPKVHSKKDGNMTSAYFPEQTYWIESNILESNILISTHLIIIEFSSFLKNMFPCFDHKNL